MNELEFDSNIFPRSFWWKAMFMILLLQLGLHSRWLYLSGNPHWIMPHLVAWLHDGLILFALYNLSRFFHWGTHARLGQNSIWLITLVFWIPIIGFLILYPRFIPDFLSFPVNVFLVDSLVAKTFFRDFVSWNDILTPVALLFPGIFLIRKIRVPLFFKLPSAIAFLLVFALVITLFHPSPNPYVYGLQESVLNGLAGGKRVVPLLQHPREEHAANSETEADSQEFPKFHGSANFSHVLVIVMETVEGSRFEKEILGNDQSFLGKHQKEFRYFSRYFTPNLDSFTSLLAMLTGISVPFPAYSDPERYIGIQKADNLAASFREGEFRAMFVCTAQHQPFVPVRGEWDRIIMRGDIDVDPFMITIDSPPVEAAVEDRAARPVIIEYMKDNPKTLILQECVFGHSQSWQDRAEMSQLEYYDGYIGELIESLQKNGLLQKTLLIVSADHGSRQDPAESENYRVPLLFWGAGIEPGKDDRFLSHRDFTYLIRETESKEPWIRHEEALLTVGHSGQWVYGEIRSSGECQFVENSRGRLLNGRGNLNPLDLHRRFQQGLNHFAARFPDPRHLRQVEKNEYQSSY